MKCYDGALPNTAAGNYSARSPFTFLVSPQSRLLLRPVHPAPARRGYSGLFPMPSIIYAFLVLSLSRTVSHLPMTGLLRQLLVSDRTRPSCT